MLEAFAILTGVGAIILYTHKVLLPLITLEMRQTRIEVVAAINRHGSAFGTNVMREGMLSGTLSVPRVPAPGKDSPQR